MPYLLTTIEPGNSQTLCCSQSNSSEPSAWAEVSLFLCACPKGTHKRDCMFPVPSVRTRVFPSAAHRASSNGHLGGLGFDSRPQRPAILIKGFRGFPQSPQANYLEVRSRPCPTKFIPIHHHSLTLSSTLYSLVSEKVVKLAKTFCGSYSAKLRILPMLQLWPFPFHCDPHTSALIRFPGNAGAIWTLAALKASNLTQNRL
jgi:hypothetical protein